MDEPRNFGPVESALISLSGCCDMARTRDGQGFNGTDAGFGHSLADQVMAGRPLSLKQKKAIGSMLPKYHKQIPNFPTVEPILKKWRDMDVDKEQARKSPPRVITLQFDSSKPQVVLSSSEPDDDPPPILEFDKATNQFFMYTRKTHPEDRQLAKDIPWHSWNPDQKVWNFKNKPEVVRFLSQNGDRFGQLSTEAALVVRAGLEGMIQDVKTEKEKYSGTRLAAEIKQGQALGIKAPLKTTPYAHQLAAFHIGITLDRSALLMEQGTGKTLSAIGVIGYRYLQKQIKRVLVIAPLSVMGEWRRQMREHADFDHEVTVLNDDLATRKYQLLNWEDGSGVQVVVTNYESTWRMPDELKAWKPNMIICDESQKIKNGQARQSKAVVDIANSVKVKYRMILTGTPVTQSPLDFFSQYRFLDDTIFGRNYRKFRNRYAEMGGYGGFKILGYKNLEELAEKAHSIAYRVTKKEALDLPEEVDQFLYAKLDAKTMRLYKAMAEVALVKLAEGKVTAPIVLTQMLRLQQITGGFLPVGEDDKMKAVQVSTAKMDVLDDALVDLIDAGKKIVIFARFIPEIDEISRRLTKHKLTHSVITGKVPSAQREKMIAQFQNDPKMRVFVAQIATGGLGITLTAGDTEIFYSEGYSLTEYEQARARIQRIGSEIHDKITYIHIIAENTIDEEVLAALHGKKDMAKMVVDDLKNIISKTIKRGDSKMARLVGEGKRIVDVMGMEDEDQPINEKELDKLLGQLEKELRANGIKPDTTPEDARDKAELKITKEDELKSHNKVNDAKDSKSEDRRLKKAMRRAKKKRMAEGVAHPEKNEPKKAKSASTSASPAAPTGDTITLKELASELGTEARKLRKTLRDKFGSGEGRWEWETNSPQLVEIRKLFKK